MAVKPKNKVRMDLIRGEQLEALAAALQNGADKYGDHGYLQESKGDIMAALLRHIASWLKGKKVDDDSNLPTSYHILAGAAILVSLEAKEESSLLKSHVLISYENGCYHGKSDCKHKGHQRQVCYNCYAGKHALEPQEEPVLYEPVEEDNG